MRIAESEVERQIYGRFREIAYTAALHARGADFRVHGDSARVRLSGQDSNGAAHGTRPVERALRPAEHLDAIDIEEIDVRCSREAVSADIERRFVYIE